ncbi:MAG: hypothetical protein LDLANPLL_01503 [Turneriella sp.]|nr:hypothetical protein [Turneriella sp.]
MPIKFATLWHDYQPYLIALSVFIVLVAIAITTLIVAIRKTQRLRSPSSNASKDTPKSQEKAPVTNAEENKTDAYGVKRAKLTIGDIASPWTQGIYERHSPEGKIDALLPPFAFDESGGIHRLHLVDAAKGVDVESILQLCNTGAGLAVNGLYATLLLWHLSDNRYKEFVLKVVSHAQIPPEQKELVRFLFQDIVGKPVTVFEVPGLKHWSKPIFYAAVELYTLPNILPKKWEELQKILPTAFLRFYELELAQKLPIRSIYKNAVENPIFEEGLYRVNLQTLRKWMNPSRWLRVYNSGNAERLSAWVEKQPCETIADALFHIANPSVFVKEDLPEELATKIDAILGAENTREWLFGDAEKPRLIYRLHYFKYFCLFARFNDAVRCFAVLGVFRKMRNYRLFYARALLMSGMLHDAWAEVASLLEDFSEDKAVLNEAAIYAHKLGRYDEASEIFSRARALFPDDTTLAYNEAVFTEEFSRVQIAEKWSTVEKLNTWAKPERIVPPPVVE